MRPIHLAHLDKTQPVVILTRELVRPHLTRVTIAPITGTIRGLSMGVENGLRQNSVVSCDNITTIPTDVVGRHIGYLLPHQELSLLQAIRAAFDLE